MLLGPRRYYFSPEFKKYIESYSWPGNLRELQIFANNIQLANESRLTDKLAHHLLNRTKEPQEFFTPYQRELIEKIGIEKFLTITKQEAYRMIFEENNKDPQKTATSLKVSLSTFYRIWGQQ